MNTMKLSSHQGERLITQKSTSFSWEQRYPSPQLGSIPLYFNCLGGNWEGQIELLKSGMLELRIQGLPPVKAGQILHFQCFGQPQASFSQITNGIIQKVYTQRGSSVWEGATHILIKQYTSQRIEKF